jgi:hypothetical protein
VSTNCPTPSTLSGGGGGPDGATGEIDFGGGGGPDGATGEIDFCRHWKIEVGHYLIELRRK